MRYNNVGVSGGVGGGVGDDVALATLYHTNCRQHPVVLIRHCVDIMLVFASD